MAHRVGVHGVGTHGHGTHGGGAHGIGGGRSGPGPALQCTGIATGFAAQFDLLRVAVAEPRAGVLVVAPSGEIDSSTADVLRRALRAAVDAGPRALVVDLSDLTFCGSTGLMALLEARDHAAGRGVGFGTAAGRPIMLRVLDVSGFGPVLRHRRTLEDALDAAETCGAGREAVVR